MKRGVVIDISKNDVVVLTTDGQFCKTRKTEQDYEIGEDIHFFPSVNPTPVNHFSYKRKLVYTLASLLMMLAIIPLFSLTANNDVYGYVSIDINPSIELTVNKKMDVIDVLAFNDEGNSLLQSLNNWKGRQFDIVTDELLENSNLQGYLTAGKEILFSTTTVSSESSKLSEIILLKQKDIEQKYEVDVSRFENDLSIHHEAINENISPGKYGLMVASVEKGYELDIEEIKNSSVAELTEKVGSVKDVVGESVTKEQLEIWQNNIPPAKGLKKNEEMKQTPGNSRLNRGNKDEKKENNGQKQKQEIQTKKENEQNKQEKRLNSGDDEKSNKPNKNNNVPNSNVSNGNVSNKSNGHGLKFKENITPHPSEQKGKGNDNRK